MIQGKVLVTGATGDTGGATVEELLSRGHRVRALAHRRDERSKQLQERGVEVVFGDLLNFGEMRAALKGVQRAYFCYPIRPGIVQATAQFAQAAKEAAVDCIVNMSQISAREDAKSHAATDHWLAERVFDWSGVTVAHVRPTYFAEWLLYLAPMIRAGLLHVPFGTGRHARDRGHPRRPQSAPRRDLSVVRPCRIHVSGDCGAPEPGVGERGPVQASEL
jgi:NAD(P)H dehydrogenase (quinone)